MEKKMKMKTKTFRFYWWEMSSQDWHKPIGERTTRTLDKTRTMPTERSLDLYAKYEAGHNGAYKYEEIINEE